MTGKYVMIALLGLVLGASTFAAEPPADAQITLKGVLQEDKNGFFLKVADATYDLKFSDDNKADMHKFYSSLGGDYVQVTGTLHVEKTETDKQYMIVYASDITRVKSETPVVVREERPVVREYYVEHHRSGIDIPFVHIHW